MTKLYHIVAVGATGKLETRMTDYPTTYEVCERIIRTFTVSKYRTLEIKEA